MQLNEDVLLTTQKWTVTFSETVPRFPEPLVYCLKHCPLMHAFKYSHEWFYEKCLSLTTIPIQNVLHVSYAQDTSGRSRNPLRGHRLPHEIENGLVCWEHTQPPLPRSATGYVW